jgi:hypothetical protein
MVLSHQIFLFFRLKYLAFNVNVNLQFVSFTEHQSSSNLIYFLHL